MGVRPAQPTGQRNPVRIGDQVPLGARFAAIRGVGADRLAPLCVGSFALSRRARSHAMHPAWPRRSSRVCCNRSQTPDPSRLPVAQPTPTGHPGPAAHLLREQFPRKPGLEDKDDPSQTGAIRNPGPTAVWFRRLWRQQRGDKRPEVIGHQWLAQAKAPPAAFPASPMPVLKRILSRTRRSLSIIPFTDDWVLQRQTLRVFAVLVS